MISVWTARDIDIVEALSRRVRLLSLELVAEIWWPDVRSLRVVRRRLRRLEGAGLIHRTTLNAHPQLEISMPLTAWRPGVDEPDFEDVSLRAKARWRTEPTMPQEVFFATRLAANLFGSTAGQLPALNHRDHDLLLGRVYMLYRTSRPAEAARWIGEDSLPKAGYGIKDPDAFLVDPTGGVSRVIESAGRYSAAQCDSFHQHCADNDLPYELW